MKKRILVVSIFAVLALTFCVACSKEAPVQQVETAEVSPEEETVEETEQEPVELETSVETRPIHISFVNQCDVDIAMLSVIQPITGEQNQEGKLPAGAAMELDVDWPVDEEEFHWALYNDAGEIYMECTTDITVASSEATITLVGDQEVKQIQEEYK